MTCPFCNYSGPSEILRDYGNVFVIEPLNPVTEGHVLVIPKKHVRDATEDRALASLVFGLAALWVLESDQDANIITSIGTTATQTVMHLHVHVVPRRAGDGLRLPWAVPA